jgi:small subunit ribosomal protein S16
MLMIRLRRMGARNRAYYRVVVSDSRRRPTAAAVEELGSYDPGKKSGSLQVNRESLDRWVAQGARLSPTIEKLLAQPA